MLQLYYYRFSLIINHLSIYLSIQLSGGLHQLKSTYHLLIIFNFLSTLLKFLFLFVPRSRSLWFAYAKTKNRNSVRKIRN